MYHDKRSLMQQKKPHSSRCCKVHGIDTPRSVFSIFNIKGSYRVASQSKAFADPAPTSKELNAIKSLQGR